MKKILIVLLLFFIVALSGDAFAGKKIRVVASSLDMADFVSRVGGEHVEVNAIFRGRTDIHFFEPIPSQVMKLKKADMLVVTGLDADAWIRGLIDASRNPRIKFGAAGYVDPSHGIRPIQVPEGRIDGAMGHVHPYGNPHYWYTPENVAIALNNIYEGLARLSPEDEPAFRRNMDTYVAEMEGAFAELKKRLAPFKGTAVIEYHKSWDYFCAYFGLDIIGTIEPKPGIPPSGKHLAEVIRIARGRDARLMLIEPYYPDKPVRRVTKETGIEAVRIPIHLGTDKRHDSYLDLLRSNVEEIIKALS